MHGSAPALWPIESLCEEAERSLPGGHASFEFLEALWVLSGALLDEGFLTHAGRAAARRALVNSLLVQGMMHCHLAEHPEIAQTPVDRPVFIVGLLRTGSTLLHNLMAQHSGLHCPELWELTSPAGERHPAAQEAAKNAAQDFLRDLYRHAPRLPGIHFMDARRPDECHRLLANTFESGIFWLRYRVPRYAKWLAGQDLTAAYAYHRLQLQSMIWRISAGIPVLKCPFHVWGLAALVLTYPDARFIYLHRDPKEVLASSSSLCAELRGARSDAVNKREIGQFWLEQVAQILDHWPELSVVHLAGRPVLHIRYPDLIRDPVGTARQACEFAGAAVTSPDAARMRRYLAANPQGLRGNHEYGAEEYGINPGEVDQRFANYRREYAF